MALPFATEYIDRVRDIIDREELLPDADFKPNVLNSVIFLIDISMQLFVFLVNYQVSLYEEIDYEFIGSSFYAKY